MQSFEFGAKRLYLMRGKTIMLQSLKSGSKSINNSSSKSGQETKLYLCFCRKRKNGRPLIGNP